MATMTKKLVYNEIVTYVTESLKTENFKNKPDGRIIRTHLEGFDTILLNIIDYFPVFQIEMSLRIRLNEVEEIINQFMPQRNPKFMKFTTTIGTSYMILSGATENYIEIKNENELYDASNELKILIKDKGLNFFKQHRNIQVVNQLKKTQILTENNYVNYVLGNLMQSLTLMRLCNDPDFENLSAKYKDLYVPFDGEEVTGRKAINNLTNYLRELKLPTPKLYQATEPEHSTLMVAEPETPYKRTPKMPNE